MRKFLLIFICAFSFCLRAETNVVQLTAQQWSQIQHLVNMIIGTYGYNLLELGEGGYLVYDEDITDFSDHFLVSQLNQQTLIEMLHLFFTGTKRDSYNVDEDNILAYASSLRGYLNSYSNSVYSIADDIRYYLPKIWERQLLGIPQIQGLYNDRFYAGNKVLDLINLSSNNFERLYTVITNIDFNVALSNQIDILNEVSVNVSGVSNGISQLNDDIQGRFVALDLEQQIRHNELMDLLRGLTNGTFFANCCGCSNSNYQDSVISMLDWMTNNFPDSVESPPISGGGGSNDVWSVWRPDGGSVSGWSHLFVPSVKWVQDGNNSQQFKPLYDNQQYDSVYNGVWDQYTTLLQEYRASGIDGQQFLAGLVDLQLHILANMSTQLYMIDSKMPSKTNLWDSINDEVNWVRDNAESVKTEVESKQYDVQSIFNHADVSLISTYFPKVQQSISKLNTTSGDPVLRIPLPSVFGSGSASDVWVVDVREIRGYDSLRDFVRWVCICIWSIILLRSFAVPVLVVVCLAARFADCSCGLLFTDTTTGCHIFGNIVGSWADFTLNLIGLDTRLKRYAVGAEAL